MMWKLLIAFMIGFTVCLVLMLAIILRGTRQRKRKRKRISLDTFAKLIVSLVMAHGMILTTLSYILSFWGLDPVVDVSSTIVREIVAPVIVYLATNMVMNIFEKNKLSFSVPLNSTYIGKDHNYLDVTDDSDRYEEG